MTVVTGPIALVALAAPQVARRLTRSGAVDLPTSALVAATMVMLSDLVARAVEIAARISRAADAPIEVRQCMDAPPDDVMEQIST